MQDKVIRIALVGQPNVGKSMLINSISNARLHVGNFSGVTVEKEEVVFEHKGYRLEITDLPGSYSLNDYTLEEKVTKQFLDAGKYDLILNVADSTNLERNLYLNFELLGLDKKIVLILNMIDEAEAENIHIDEKKLSSLIGKTCIKTSAAKKMGLESVLDALILIYERPKEEPKEIFSSHIEDEIKNILAFLGKNELKTHFTPRQLAINLLKQDRQTYQALKDEPLWDKLEALVTKAHENICSAYSSHDLEDIFNNEKFAFARSAVAQCMRQEKAKELSLTDKIDKILINKYLGLPIFLFFMWGLFQLTFVIGKIPMDWIDASFAQLACDVKELLGNGQLGSMIGDGAVAGVGAVLVFLPNIIILFLGIALLEGTGYMSRVAFLLDGFLHKFGLHGKSFIPLVSGFGCSVPAYMAARTLKNERDRLLTLFIIGFMSCGARLPIYVLFTGAFFGEDHAGNALFAIYLGGAVLGLIAAKVLKIVVFKSEDEPFVMEMPKYRMPSLKLLYRTVSNKALMYLKKAGTYILAASLLIWFASNYPKHHEMDKQFEKKIELASSDAQKTQLANDQAFYNLEHSYLGFIGKVTNPFFAPLGFDWKMAVALETGLAAKEVVVSTLGVLYGLGGDSDEKSKGLQENIKNNIPFAAAISFIVFVMTYMPCMAASVVFTREAGGMRYLGYLFLFTTSTAWVLSFITYHVVQWII